MTIIVHVCGKYMSPHNKNQIFLQYIILLHGNNQYV